MWEIRVSKNKRRGVADGGGCSPQLHRATLDRSVGSTQPMDIDQHSETEVRELERTLVQKTHNWPVCLPEAERYGSLLNLLTSDLLF